MNLYKISVIVPVYNKEEYVEESLNSLVNQSIFDDIEVILIDDGSTDNSLQLIEKFSKDYENIKVFNKENEGLTFTRNYGIDLAKGEYIHFMDADDYIPSDVYEKLYNFARKYDHDVVSGNFLRFNSEKVWRESISRFITGKITKTIESTTLNQCSVLTWDSVVWNKLYKTSFLRKNNIKFPYERITFEDNIFSIEAYILAKSIGFLNEDVYYWREDENKLSLSTSDDKVTFKDKIKIMGLVNDCMREYDCSKEIIEIKYLKWLKGDLKNLVLSIPTLDTKYPEKYIEKVKEILNLGPGTLLNDLTNYYKLLYKIILDGNLEDLIEFRKNSNSDRLLKKYNINNKISVIVPVYNGEKYIRECLDSIVNQTLGIENIEVIIVDDSSIDNSVDIINEYVSKYPSFKLIKQQTNQGSGPARNLGLKYVTNDFVTYLDCDDKISLNAYEKALEIFESDNDVDLVMYKWEEFDDRGLLNYNDIAKNTLKRHKIVTNINDYPELIFATYVYIKVYSKRLFKYLEFPPRSYQDNIVSARVMINSDKIYITEDVCCYYRQRPDSTSKEISTRNYLNLLIASKQVIDLRDESSSKYYDILSFLALKLTYWAIAYICNRPDFSLFEGCIIYDELKKYPKYFSKDVVKKYEANFPSYLPCNEQSFWDVENLNFNEYLIKNRYEKNISNLKKQVSNLSNENAKLLSKHKKLTKNNKKLKNSVAKEKKLNKDILKSRSWKLTAPIRRLRNKCKTNSISSIFKIDSKKRTIAIKTPNAKSEHHWGDYYMALALKKSFEKKGLNVIIHEKEDWYKKDEVDIVLVLRGLYKYEVNKNHINIMWNISHPELVDKQEYEQYDAVFISSKMYTKKIKKETNTLVYPLLQCSDPEIFYPHETNECRHDILFVGIGRENREIIRDILKTDYPVSVYGKHWNEKIDKKYVCGEFIPNEDLHKYYSSCKILLNDHWKDMKEWDFPSNRLFDALLCETLVISDKIPSASTVFKDCIVTYEGVDDLKKKVGYYLENPSEREKLAKKGKEIVLKNHTFDNRVDFIMNVLDKL